MKRRGRLFCLVGLSALMCGSLRTLHAGGREHHRLYVAVPGIRNDVTWGGVGLLVYDMDSGHKLLKRIPTLATTSGADVEPVKGVCANAKTARLYLSTPNRLLCMDLTTEQILWDKTFPGGCDRMALSPDGATLYVPMLEGPNWNVVNAHTGDLLTTIQTNSGAHNTVYGLDGKHVYLAGLKSPLLFVADAKTHTAGRMIGPFSNVIRPFTVNGRQSLCFVNVNDRLGFEVGDLHTGAVLCKVDVPNAKQGPVKRHGCPSHGIGLTPDETELWLSDGFNSRMHVFDATRMPPTLLTSIPLRDQPGWVTFSLDGKYAYPSPGEVIDTQTKRVVTTLADERGRPVASEKMVEIDFTDDKPTHAGDQFGLGRKR